MDVQEIQKQVIAVIAVRFEDFDGEITPDMSFEVDLGADSLDSTELVMELEDEFDIDISDDEAEKIKTVGQAIDVVTKLVAENEVASDV